MNCTRRYFVAFYTLLIAGLFVVSCKGEQQEMAHQEMEQEENTHFTVAQPGFPTFSSGTAELLDSWPAFQDFQREITEINGQTLVELRNRTSRLLTYADSISRSVPDSLKVQPLLSRMVVVNSYVRLLDQKINKDIIDSAAVAEDLKGLLISTANFYGQINQKLQKDAIDLQRREDEASELEKQKRFRDSVFAEELNDKNRQKL